MPPDHAKAQQSVKYLLQEEMEEAQLLDPRLVLFLIFFLAFILQVF